MIGVEGVVVIDLTDRQTYGVATLLALGWGTALILVIYNIVRDITDGRKARRPRPATRSFRGPCASELHEFVDGTCATCGAAEESPE